MSETRHTSFSFDSSVAREFFFVFAIFFIAPFFEKRGEKTGIRSCQSERALLTSRKRHSSVARALSFAAGRKHCGAAQFAALKHITACFLVLLGGSLCHLRLPQYLTLPLLRLRAVLQRSAPVCACRGRNRHTPPSLLALLVNPPPLPQRRN